jgi:hypothetical protein
MVVSTVTCRRLHGGWERADFDYMVIRGYEMSTTCRLHACDLCRRLSSYTGCSPDNAYTQSCVSFGKGRSLVIRGPQVISLPPRQRQQVTEPAHNLWTDRVDRHHMGRPFCTRVKQKNLRLCVTKFNDFLKVNHEKLN